MSSSAPSAASQPKGANRLIHATSPYLLQHAHNPVDWYPWGDEALARARAEDKPIFLSIGYAACHWCHVMERESFENEAIAAILNAHFVSIKVDREERPDLDDIYMTATQLYNQGGGGWPMSVFLTPDGKPFFAGTYFPPEGRWGRPGFGDLLNTIARLWKNERDKVLQGADSLARAVVQLSTTADGPGDVPPLDTIERTVTRLAQAFDWQFGGMAGGGTNKFPPSMAMDLMLREHHRTSAAGKPNQDCLELVEVTLDRMARGGIYDQLAGGIARYSTDVEWLVPHFEKMLYDQALVAGIYLDAFQVAGKPLYARIAGEILDYVIADLQSPGGGYYSARDADSEGEEGRYYVWTRAEVAAMLGDDAEAFCAYYDVSDAGNWEGRNILHVPRDETVVAKMLGLPVDDLRARLTRGRERLLAARGKRVPPLRDDKVLSAWNGLMIAAMARGAGVLDEPRYLASAERAADFVLKQLRRDDGRLLRSWRAGRAHTLGFLDDHAFLIEGLLNLFEATGELRWLDEAARLADDVEKHFADDKAGGYYFAPDDGEKLLVRGKDASDGAIPSGNSVHLMNLLRLAVLLDDAQRLAQAERLMRCFSERVRQSPFSSERLLAALDFYHRRPREIVLVAPPDESGLAQMQRALWCTYVPNKVVVIVRPGAPRAESLSRRVRLAADKKALDGRATAYVCRDFVCKKPTTDVNEYVRLLRE